MNVSIYRSAGLAFALICLIAACPALATDYYWRTDGNVGTFDDVNWYAGAANSGNLTAFTSDKTNNAIFTANSTVYGPANATSLGNLTVSNGAFVQFQNIHSTLFSGGIVHTLDITGVLDTGAQSFSTATNTGFIKNGSGVFSSANPNVYTGGFTLNNGTVVIASTNTLGGGPLTINGGAITASASRAYATGRYSSITVGGNFTLGGVTTGASANAIASANISFADSFNLGSASRVITIGTGATGTYTPGPLQSSTSGVGLTINGASGATFAFANTNNTYSGPTNLNGGTFTFASSGVNSFTATSAVNFTGSGTLTWGVGQSDDLSTKLAAGSGIASGAVATFFIPSGSNVQFASGLTGAGGIQQGGAGKLILLANSSYQGPTSVAGTGSLQVGFSNKAGSLGSNTGPITFTGSGGGHLVYYRTDKVIVNNQITGDGSLWQAGSGTLVLTANNSNYTRGTTLQAGALLLENGSGSATGSGSITVSNNTLLGGAGVSTSAFTLNTGGKIAPGTGGTTGLAASVGVLTLGDGTFSFGSNYQLEVNAISTSSAVSDQIVMGAFTGDATGKANLVLSRVDSLGQLAYGTSFTIIKTTTDLRSTSDPKAAATLAGYFTLPTDATGTQYAISETADAIAGTFDIVLTSNTTPELGSISLFGSAAAALLLSRRRHVAV